MSKFNSQSAVKTGATVLTFGILSSILLSLSACGNSFQPAADPVANSIDGSLGCQNFEEELWNAFNKAIEETGRPPSGEELEAALGLNRKNFRLGKISASTQNKIAIVSGKIASIVSGRTAGEIQKFKFDISTTDANQPSEKSSNFATASSLPADRVRGFWLERIAQLEIGDRTTDTKSRDVDAIRAAIQDLKSMAESESILKNSCATVPAAPPLSGTTSTMIQEWSATEARPVYGALKTAATMYQSCEAATRKPLGSDTPDVEGISVVGQHSSGTGNVRKIANHKAYLATHPYIGNAVYRRPLASCFDVQASSSIYDYGGKPFTTTAQQKVLDLFKNAGSGSKELGIDCSAFVFTAYATAGLKFVKSSPLKAALVNGVSSTMLTEPQKNGLTCMNHAPFLKQASLNPGDLIAIKGHVVMISDVGDDPLGIGNINSLAECKLAKMDIARFNFSIFQSAPTQGGIGVNRMRARDYLASSSTMARGMLDHAVNACKAKFQSTMLISKSTSASIVRHIGTPECTDTTAPVILAKEECLSSCSVHRLER